MEDPLVRPLADHTALPLTPGGLSDTDALRALLRDPAFAVAARRALERSVATIFRRQPQLLPGWRGLAAG